MIVPAQSAHSTLKIQFISNSDLHLDAYQSLADSGVGRAKALVVDHVGELELNNF